ncbi:protease inhibitor I42 family protein [Nocardia transvalensis]|uniref:protease inhibitor I42 family protein n=1 Tax=Nocardia transvalensis TaxID=37333 RepID=UPI001895105A|nr:protease inhibitor I42 family protein [Nocardia transvalensis]MBF6331495.1 hypothetical protein [Nocardia transvalensis]
MTATKKRAGAAARSVAAVAAALVAVGFVVFGPIEDSVRPVGNETTLQTVTESDNGRSVDLQVGDVIAVRLAGDADDGYGWLWSRPDAGVDGVLHRTAGDTRPDGSATATFTANGPGTVDIEAYQRCEPRPGTMCIQSVKTWKVTVTVR